MSEQGQSQRRRLPPEAIAAIIVAALVVVALYIRIHLPYDRVFVNDWVWFRETDAYYYLRNIESLVHNFPRFNAFDPYMLYPGGGEGLARPFFGWLAAGAALLVGRGAPAQHTIEAVSAYMPAILGALTLIPVYFIGRELFNRWAGVIAAALLAVLPGEFLHRSLLGFTDHHIAEVLLSTTAMLFLIMAVRRARERELSFGHLLSRDWPVIGRPLLYTLLSGIFLGFYLLSWVGGLLFIFIIFAYLVIQFVVDHLRGRATDYLCIIGSPLFLIALIMLLPVMGDGWAEGAYRVSLPVAILVPAALSVVSRLLTARAWKPVYYPLVLVVLAGIGLAILRIANPALLARMLGLFEIFAPGGARLTILEMHPLTLGIAWANFTTSFFISLVALAMLAYAAVKERSADKTLILVWSVVMLAAVLGQRRFGYYFAVNAALLTGYFCWRMLDIAGLHKLLTGSAAAVTTFVKHKKKAVRGAQERTYVQPRGVWVRVIVVGILLFFLAFFPNFGLAGRLAGGQHFIGQWFEQGWYSSLLWLRGNSPEPFGDPDFYYQPYPRRSDFEYPETAYGVMSWWDYGHFIMQISRRIPNANPGQVGAVQAARFFTATDEASASEIADNLRSRYVVIDYMMATSKFYAMVEWAGRSLDEYYGVYYQTSQEGWLAPVILYHPAYFETPVVRLYSFNGEAVTPSESIVISWAMKTAPGGLSYREITSVQTFATYGEAVAYIAGQPSGDYKIVSANPLSTPVPLEPMSGYQLVHESEETVLVGNTSMPGVKIFEYLGYQGS